jgi:hypothetical protein
LLEAMLAGGRALIPRPLGWRLTPHGDALRRRYGPLELRLYRRPGRAGWYLGITVRMDVHDRHEAAALAETVTRSWSAAHPGVMR